MQLPTQQQQQQDTPAAATAACGTEVALLVLDSLCLTCPRSFSLPFPPLPPVPHYTTTTPPPPATYLDTVKGCSANHSPGVINKVLRKAPEENEGVKVAVG